MIENMALAAWSLRYVIAFVLVVLVFAVVMDRKESK